MSGRLGIDFGTSNTVVAGWDEARQEGIPLHIPDYGRYFQQGEEQISVVPSLIHYTADRRRWVGNQVLQHKLYHSPRTFRWMKRYIGNRSPVKAKLDGREISYQEAGQDFLSSVLLFAAQELGNEEEEVALTVPVEAFEHYENWLSEVVGAAGMPRFRLIDEPSAAALGYGSHIQPGKVYLIFDFGGGTLDVAVVLIEEELKPGESGRRCRVLGKAGTELGGATLDQWLFQEVLRQNGRSDIDEEVRQVSKALLVECEQAKERLSAYPRASVSVVNPYTGSVLAADFTQAQFEGLLDQRDAFSQLDQTIRRALNGARERGYHEDSIQSVLLVGGSSQIPAVQRTIQRIFGRERVKLERPLDAVARGAAAFVAGVDFFDHIQHDYAVRFLNREKGGYDYRVVVTRGTVYPTAKPLARLTVKASYTGQTQMGLALFEMSTSTDGASTDGAVSNRSTGGAASHKSGMELVFDPSGAARIVEVRAEEEERRSHFWMNEHSPTFLTADPPAEQGEARFAVEFNIDSNKRLLITATDLKTGHLTHRNYPVVKLT
ncbi:MAG: Hsp70 family protein [Chloroflexota bacterium]